MMPVVFIAGPFRADTGWAVEENIRRAERVALQVWKAGAAALCPHTNSRFFHGEGHDQLWLDGYLAILQRCDAVLLLPNWRESSGARAEHDAAIRAGIPIFHDIRDVTEWIEATWITRNS